MKYMIDSDPKNVSTLRELLESNVEFLLIDEVREIVALKVGQKMKYGGGAVAEIVIEAVEESPSPAPETIICNDCGSKCPDDYAFPWTAGGNEYHLCASCQDCKRLETIAFLRKQATTLEMEIARLKKHPTGRGSAQQVDAPEGRSARVA